MGFTRHLAGAALIVVGTMALAQAPFQISGLHPDLAFTDAIIAIEKLGAQCRTKQSRSEGGGVSAECALPRAGVSPGEPGTADVDQSLAGTPGPAIASQPITRIGIEAPVESAQVTRIVFVFDGSLDAVAQYLVQQYGQPDHGGTPAAESWSHSKRRSWSRGNYTLGLLNSPDLVILTVNRAAPNPDAS